MSEVEEMFYIAGPGSYTGTRLGAGIGDLTEWSKIKTYSFYHFDIPYFLGIRKGHWFCKAFKNEIYLYSWNEEVNESKLIDENIINEFLEKNGGEMYSSEQMSVNFSFQNTNHLLRENSEKIFRKIKELNLKKETFYFRTAENEFKLPPKS
jgi:tRNA threonylcarbamoyladenosine biosynthesis protein TsaB